MKVTAEQILEWHGDGTMEELAEYLATILNGDFPVEKAKEEIQSY